MNPDGIAAIGAGMAEGLPDAALVGNPASAGAAAQGFTSLVSEGLQQVNQQLKVSEAGLQRLALGDSGNLHQLMIQLEESRISFQLAMQVRSRLLEAYQEVSRMQV